MGQSKPTQMAGCRATLLYELALEFAFRVPYESLLGEAQRTGACEEIDLLCLGRRIYLDLARLATGAISGIGIPARLPKTGEHAG